VIVTGTASVAELSFSLLSSEFIATIGRMQVFFTSISDTFHIMSIKNTHIPNEAYKNTQFKTLRNVK